MKQKKIFQILFFMLFFILSVNGFADPVKDLSKARSIYTEDNQNIIVTKGQTSFTLKLKSNPTTGYSWFLRSYDMNLLIPLKHEFQKSNQKLMGASGYEVWVFQVKQNAFIVPQQTTIRMVYTRPWQVQDSGTQLVFRVTIMGK